MNKYLTMLMRRLYGAAPLNLAAVILSWLIPATAIATSSDQPASNPASSGLLLGFLIAYATRKRAIGGWLLYFYMQLYGSFVLGLILLPQGLGNLNPSQWDSSKLYVLYMLSYVPAILASWTEVVVGSVLLKSRNESKLNWLRMTQIALLVANLVSILIDYQYFKEGANLVVDTMGLFFSSVWLVYFRKSIRVQKVFVENSWVFAEGINSPKMPKTPNELRYLRKRALIAFVITFGVLFVLKGISAGDTKPEYTQLVYIPLIYAVIAAAIGYFSPISKKKSAELINGIQA